MEVISVFLVVVAIGILAAYKVGRPDTYSPTTPRIVSKPRLPPRIIPVVPKIKATFSAPNFDATQIRGPCYVVDGDTITIKGMNIRLAGIDAPEMDHPWGKNAKWHLLSLTKGQVVIAYFEGAQSYAREVATCFLPDGRDLSAEMVKAGFAIDWPKYSGGKYRQYEQPVSRKRMWRTDARQRGQWPPKPQG